MSKKISVIFCSLLFIVLVCVFGYYKYTCHRYVEIAQDYKETIYKATIISCKVVSNVKALRENNEIITKTFKQPIGQNEGTALYGQLMDNDRSIKNIIGRGNVILEDLVKRAYVDFGEMKKLSIGHKDEQKFFEKKHAIAKPMINNCKRGNYPSGVGSPYEKEKNAILDMLEETDHSIGAVSKDAEDFCKSKILDILM